MPILYTHNILSFSFSFMTHASYVSLHTYTAAVAAQWLASFFLRGGSTGLQRGRSLGSGAFEATFGLKGWRVVSLALRNLRPIVHKGC